MRCKPNELCVISYIPHAALIAFKGRFVTTVRRAQEGDFNTENVNHFGPAWIVGFSSPRPEYLDHNHKMPPTIGIWPDAWLRPIRDDGSQFDESMFWGLYARA
jgi:hypothetical protein